MFDYFLFERYGLKENEENSSLIKQALDKKKEDDGWENALKATNERKRNKAVESKKKWEQDGEILLNPAKRQKYLEDLMLKVAILIDGADEDGDEYFETFSATEDISMDEARALYDKYKAQQFEKNNQISEEAIEVALMTNEVEKNYEVLVSSLKDDGIAKLSEKQIDISSVAETLKIYNCFSKEDIETKLKYVCDTVYELYNKQILSPEFQKGFFEIFSLESKNENAFNKLLKNENFEKVLKTNNWVLLKYIKTTCLLMKRKKISSENTFANILNEDVEDFAEALGKVFGVNITINFRKAESKSSEPKFPQEELEKGMQLLSRGQFKEAKIHFENQTRIDPYGWKAYWGLFKCEIEISNDENIYFPGFTSDLRQSYISDISPQYIEYYKTAKFNAAASRATEINFNNVELEYKKADSFYESYKKEVKRIIKSYEQIEEDNIRLEEGKETAKKINDTKRNYRYWSDIKLEGLSISGFLLLFSLLFINLAVFPITYESPSAISIISVASVFLLPIIVGVIIGSTFGIPFGVLTVVGGIGAPFGLISILSENFDEPMRTILFITIFAIPAIILIIIAMKRVVNLILSKGKMKQLHSELDDLVDEYLVLCVTEIENMSRKANISKYHIVIPNETIDTSVCYDFDLP